jgi:hypothetical protein
LVPSWIEFDACELWITVVVCERRLRALADHIAYRSFVKELEVGVNIW